MAKIRYYIDPRTGSPHIWGHGVSEEEVEDAIQASGEDRPGRDGSRIAVGRSGSGRYLRVVYVPDPALDSVFVITAYELKGKPLSAYRLRIRKRK